MRSKTLSMIIAVLLAAGTAACGSGTGERAASGGGIGAAAGAAGAAVTGGSAVTGGLLGGAAGAAAGALTDEDDIDLGDPAWK